MIESQMIQSNYSLNENIQKIEILKNLYETNFFSDVRVKIETIFDYYSCWKSIIENINYEGIKLTEYWTFKRRCFNKTRYSFNEILKERKFRLNQILKDLITIDLQLKFLLKKKK